MDSLGLQSRRAQLIATVVATSAVTFGLITTYQNYSRRQRRHQLDLEVRQSLAAREALELSAGSAISKGKERGDNFVPRIDLSSSSEYDEELIREQLARCYAIFKDEGMDRIRKSSVVVVGCGGVGSWAAVMLARSGVSKIRLVDFDYVTLSSLNRHATATAADVGTPKVYCIERTLRQISRWVQVDSRLELWRKEDGAKLLEGVDWVVDAIDNITTKVDLLKYCHSKGIKVMASMGAGGKLDPTRIQISDISCTAEDPLSRSVRIQLRKAGISSGVPVVYSTEQPEEDLKLLPLAEEERERGAVHELAAHDDFRVRVLPVFGPIPAIFGLQIASYIACEIAGHSIHNPLWIKNRTKTYEKLLRELKVREEKVLGETINRLPIDENDVAYIYEDLHRGRSLIPPHVVPNKPSLTRWDPKRPLTVQNCVVLDGPELKKHLAGIEQGETPEEIWGDEVARIVNKRMGEAGVWWERNMR